MGERTGRTGKAGKKGIWSVAQDARALTHLVSCGTAMLFCTGRGSQASCKIGIRVFCFFPLS